MILTSLFLFLALTMPVATSLAATPIPQCNPMLNGYNYDFTPLSVNDSVVLSGQFTFTINPCVPIQQTACCVSLSSVGICQVWGPCPTSSASLGDIRTTQAAALDNQTESDGGFGATLNVTGGQMGRSYEIDLLCDHTVSDVGQPVFQDEVPQLHYRFVWATCYACPPSSAYHCNGADTTTTTTTTNPFADTTTTTTATTTGEPTADSSSWTILEKPLWGLFGLALIFVLLFGLKVFWKVCGFAARQQTRQGYVAVP